MFSNYRKHALDALLLGLSSATKLTTGVLIFLVLARVLGAEDFGRLMFAFSLANLSALPVNFGLTVFFLREGALTSDYGAQLIPQIVGVRLIFAALIAVAAGVSIWLIEFQALLYVLFLAVALLDTFVELMLARLRLGAKYKVEMRFSVIQALVQISIVVALALLFANPWVVAAGFLASRATALGIAWKFALSLGPFRLCPRFHGAFKLVKLSAANFYDFLVQSSLIYLDVILLGLMSSPAQVGVYQSAMKIVQGLSQGVSILVNLMLPRISRKMAAAAWRAKHAAGTYAVFVASGAVLAGLMWSASDFIEHRVLDDSFAGFSAVLVWLAPFLFVRYVGAAGGLLMIAKADRKVRPSVMSLALVMVGGLATMLVPVHGAIGMAAAMLSTYAFIAASLFLAVIVDLERRRPT